MTAVVFLELKAKAIGTDLDYKEYGTGTLSAVLTKFMNDIKRYSQFFVIFN